MSDIQAETGALVVLVGIYRQAFGCGANDPAIYPAWTKWDYDIAEAYNPGHPPGGCKDRRAFRGRSHAMGDADWLLNPDCCHLNDLGHVLIGHAIFEVLARHCKGLAIKTARLIQEYDITIANSGGANTNEEIRELWSAAAKRFSVAD